MWSAILGGKGRIVVGFTGQTQVTVFVYQCCSSWFMPVPDWLMGTCRLLIMLIQHNQNQMIFLFLLKFAVFIFGLVFSALGTNQL